MSQRKRQFHPSELAGAKKIKQLTSGTNYVITHGGGGYLDKIINSLGITGTIIISDQAAANSATKLLNAQATSASVATVKTDVNFSAQPAYPRRILITPGGTTADVKACNVTVKGKDWEGNLISENIALTENQTGTSTGTLRFASVYEVSIPAQDGANATFSIGEASGDTIDVITNPTVGLNFKYERILDEGLTVVLSTTSDVIASYLE